MPGRTSATLKAWRKLAQVCEQRATLGTRPANHLSLSSPNEERAGVGKIKGESVGITLPLDDHPQTFSDCRPQFLIAIASLPLETVAACAFHRLKG